MAAASGGGTALSQFVHLSPTKYLNSARILEPEARSGHCIVADQADLYAVGGYNPDYWERENEEDSCYPLFRELWKFSVATRKWNLLKTRGHFPTELASHTVLVYGHDLVMFGGTGVPFGDAASNQLNKCSLTTLTWSAVPCSGDFPARVYGHVMFILGEYLYVFGGTTGWEYNSDVHRLSLQSFIWERVETQGTPPEGRYRHEVAVYRNKMYVLGGGRSYTCYSMDKLPVLDLQGLQWETAATLPDSQQGYPIPRRCHSCVHFKESAYICGGYNGDVIFGDLWQLYFPTMQWIHLKAELPKPLYFHSSAVTKDGRMLTFGGVTQIEMERTGDVLSIWLSVPSLRELCWSLVTALIPNMDVMLPPVLQELGIPGDLLSRVDNHHKHLTM